ncbi:tRNA intron endonuclease, catalytic C-terminal domain containing protein [Trichomonas vaginalis G3]|uniref:tRNA-intron lyase n=1 Tax=Trichomonas vaginalis (strain ATCC PRA-98 / G3) TaxID=412133 RepID=A2EQ54_TRIV3|nr:tRNA-splicing endonuclease subunit SEN2 family [Trichomonas vaginalis G3]EAY05229.1 tRNA intron endonuclease, catalytic C-terminal domain containing protein [Trichomonas vaginalis G3]KAI5542604.1 tRNA-splicing endonuclease subunit SEN2 family [Trichomonas vaginalis G3]|eukprot:XP_001317452.1 tRNA intron endonuclease, catalytic C-terminal domain containing protein [Trichomonas vaginalis G3]
MIDVSYENSIFFITSSITIRNELVQKFAFGRMLGEKCILSAYEVFFLYDVCKSVNISFNRKELWDICSGLSQNGIFARNYSVYRYYRSLLWVVRDGSVFGCEFVLYHDHPEVVHSSFIVRILENWDNFENEALTITRIGWFLKKRGILCVVKHTDNIDYSDPDSVDLFEIESFIVKRVKFR